MRVKSLEKDFVAAMQTVELTGPCPQLFNTEQRRCCPLNTRFREESSQVRYGFLPGEFEEESRLHKIYLSPSQHGWWTRESDRLPNRVSPPLNLVSSMADDAIHALICLVEGDSSVFIVEPTGDMDIMDLKDLIWEENKNNVLNGVDSSDLILWKVMSL